METYRDYLEHHGIKGMRWGVRKSVRSEQKHRMPFGAIVDGYQPSKKPFGAKVDGFQPSKKPFGAKVDGFQPSKKPFGGGIRRYRNEDGSLTQAGKKRYGKYYNDDGSLNDNGKKLRQRYINGAYRGAKIMGVTSALISASKIPQYEKMVLEITGGQYHASIKDIVKKTAYAAGRDAAEGAIAGIAAVKIRTTVEDVRAKKQKKDNNS